jgi:hypothetical protein
VAFLSVALQLLGGPGPDGDGPWPGSSPPGGRAQQRAYRTLVRQPRLIPEGLAQLPPGLRRVVQATVLAGRELRKLNGPAGRRPRWRILTPAPPGQLLAAYRAAEAKLAVPGSTWPPSTWSRPDSGGSQLPDSTKPRA